MLLITRKSSPSSVAPWIFKRNRNGLISSAASAGTAKSLCYSPKISWTSCRSPVVMTKSLLGLRLWIRSRARSVTARFATACLTKSNSILSNKSSGYVFKTYGRPILSAVHAIFVSNTFGARMFTQAPSKGKGQRRQRCCRKYVYSGPKYSHGHIKHVVLYIAPKPECQ